MQIEFLDKVVETDKLSDKEAAITEALANLHKVCQTYNVTSLSEVILNPNRHLSQLTVVKGSDEQINESFDFMMRVINEFVSKSSGGQLMLMRATQE